LQENRKRKLFLIIAIVLFVLVALILVFYYNGKKAVDNQTNQGTTAGQQTTDQNGNLPNGPTEFADNSLTAIQGATATATVVTGSSGLPTESQSPNAAGSTTPGMSPVASTSGITAQNQASAGKTATSTQTNKAATSSKTATPTATPIVIGYFDWSKNLTQNITIPQDIQQKVASQDICQINGLSDSWSNPFEKTLCGMERSFMSQIMEPLYALECNLDASALASNYGSNIQGKVVNGQCLIIDR
jgi:hypothetical protein